MDIKTLGGTFEPTETSKYLVSLWYVPGGADYHDARVIAAFFEDEASAKKLEQDYLMPPEMAHCSQFDQEARERWKRNKELEKEEHKLWLESHNLSEESPD